jgi:hypothetical protein
MGYIRDGKLVILSPQRKIESFIPNFISGTSTKTSPDQTLINEAIAWYQSANYLYKNGGYKMTK